MKSTDRVTFLRIYLNTNVQTLRQNFFKVSRKNEKQIGLYNQNEAGLLQHTENPLIFEVEKRKLRMAFIALHLIQNIDY